MKFKLVVIDDNMELSDPFIRRFQKEFPEVEISEIFIDSNQGLEYVLQNLNQRMIVFLDCKFDTSNLQGIDVLRKIREQTSLLYIVMMSANQLNQFAPEDVKEMINEESIYFVNNNESQKAIEIIHKIQHHWETKFDCILEYWLQKHIGDNEVVAIQRGDKSYTWKEVLNEVRMQTEVGRDIERAMNQYTVFSFQNSHRGK